MTTNPNLSMPLPENRSRWQFGLIPALIFQPRATLQQIAAATDGMWQTPIWTLVGTALLQTLVAGSLKATAAANGQIELPPGFEYYTPEQQAQFMQAMNATSGPVFTYVLPAAMAFLWVFMSWMIIGGFLHLVLTLMGGRNSANQLLNITAWASLPYALRDLVRVLGMSQTGQLLAAPGLMGLVPAGEETTTIFLAAVLALVDIYAIWHVILLIIGSKASSNLGLFKTILGVLATILILVLVRAVPALISAQFSDLTVIGPLF
jgi:hypothetical protein